jgi:hypothetical protein
VQNEPFWRLKTHGQDSSPTTKTDTTPSVTSFLCTKYARDIFGRARADLRRLASGEAHLAHPDYRPGYPDGSSITTARTNAEALDEAAGFLNYATGSGRRGTPHH